MLLAFSHWVTVQLFHLDLATRWGATVAFFIYDSIKINLLLVGLIFVIAVIRSFIPHEAMKRWMSDRGFLGLFCASLFGAVTPFCSCSSIPIFISFLRVGAPLGAMFSFLITSPLINEYLVVLMLGLFGWKITLAYVISGMAIGIVSGMILGRMNLEHLLVEDMASGTVVLGEPKSLPGFAQKISFAWKEAVSILAKIWLWVLLGVAMGAYIHNYVPQQMIDAVISSTGIFSVPIAVLIGVPMYGSCAAIVPVAVALFQKGVPLGTALSFMMAISALSLPEAVMLRRAMKLKLILIFFGVTTLAIMAIGYLFNALQHVLI
ncbi:MAG: permease [Candidatus Omnitrophica bacterium]|nr:permease [Candidatus Omnitrophota bacterium]